MTDTNTTTEDVTADEIAASAATIRPLEQLPSNWTVKGNPSILTPTLSGLSPDDQAAVRKRAGNADPEVLQAALMGFLRERSAEARLLTGAGEGATDAERTALDQMATLRQLSRESERIEAELADVSEHRTEYVDGKPVAVPVYRYRDHGRTIREARLAEIRHHMALLAGVEGEKELQDAARADVLRTREVRRQLDEEAEAKSLADRMLRDERVTKRAEAIAKHNRQVLN